MHRILTRICAGEGRAGDIETLEELSDCAIDASLCALGKSAPDPFLSTLRYFREEYEEHIAEKKCRALSCQGLISYWIDPDLCRGCTICMKKCPSQGVEGERKLLHVINQDHCDRCGVCFEVCPAKYSAVRKLSGRVVPDTPPPGAELIAGVAADE